jgi:hypothetical protein
VGGSQPHHEKVVRKKYRNGSSSALYLPDSIISIIQSSWQWMFRRKSVVDVENNYAEPVTNQPAGEPLGVKTSKTVASAVEHGKDGMSIA